MFGLRNAAFGSLLISKEFPVKRGLALFVGKHCAGFSGKGVTSGNEEFGRFKATVA